MRKLIVVLLMAGLVFATCSPAYAILDRFNQDQKIKVYVKVNTSDTAYAREYLTSSSAGILVPGVHRILGWSICRNSNSPESLCAIWDCAADLANSADDTTKLEAEAELSTTEGSRTDWLAYPYEIKLGVVASVGPNTTLTIYYEDYRR